MLKHQPIGFLKHSQLQGIFWPLAHANRSSISNSWISSSTKHLFGPLTIHEPGFVRTTRAIHNKHTEAARECSQFEAGTPNVAMSVGCLSIVLRHRVDLLRLLLLQD